MADATAAQVAGVPVEFDIGGTKYKFRRFRPLGDNAEGAVLLCSEALGRFRANYGNIAVYGEGLAAKAFAELCKWKPTEEEVRAFLESNRGAMWQVWQCAKAYQPNLTEQGFTALIEANGGMPFFNQLYRFIGTASGMVFVEASGTARPTESA